MEERRRRVRPKPIPAWPSDPLLCASLVRWVEAGTRPSLHALARSEPEQVRAGPLPRAAQLAGTFPPGSGPNCFGTVMAAAGEPVEHEWVQQDQFQAWLDSSIRPSREGVTQSGAGTRGGVGDVQVLVWHEHGQLAHAALALPGGWVLQKPSPAWSSPVGVWTATEVIGSWRLPGVRLSRHRLR